MKRLLIFLSMMLSVSATVLQVPGDYDTLDDALKQVLAKEGSFTIELAPGSYSLTKSLYATLPASKVTIKADSTQATGRYYGHLVGTFQGDQVTGQGPFKVQIAQSTVSVEPTKLSVAGKEQVTGSSVSFTDLEGHDLLVYRHHGLQQYSIRHAQGNQLTLTEELAPCAPGEGIMIKPLASLAASNETVTFKGSWAFEGIFLEGATKALGENQLSLERCVSEWHISAPDLSASQVIHLGGVEVTHTYAGECQTFLGVGLRVYANKYARDVQSCFIGAAKGIEAGTYAHVVCQEAEWFGCDTALWADGGSQVAAPKSWIRSCDRGMRLSANACCMVSDWLAMTDVDLGIRALFNSQVHVTSLYLDKVRTHAHIDEQFLEELLPPVQSGIRTLDPEGYGAYHSGVSYNTLVSSTYSQEAVKRSYLYEDKSGTFLDSIPSEPFIKEAPPKPFVMPIQKRPDKKKRPRPKKHSCCFCNCGVSPDKPCCKKKEKKCKNKRIPKCKAPCKSKPRYHPNCVKGCLEKCKGKCTPTCGKFPAFWPEKD